jgi:hypothetical protein
VFGSFRFNILSREGLTAAKRKAKERSRGKLGEVDLLLEQLDGVFASSFSSPARDKDHAWPPFIPSPSLYTYTPTEQSESETLDLCDGLNFEAVEGGILQRRQA